MSRCTLGVPGARGAGGKVRHTRAAVAPKSCRAMGVSGDVVRAARRKATALGRADEVIGAWLLERGAVANSRAIAILAGELVDGARLGGAARHGGAGVDAFTACVTVGGPAGALHQGAIVGAAMTRSIRSAMIADALVVVVACRAGRLRDTVRIARRRTRGSRRPAILVHFARRFTDGLVFANQVPWTRDRNARTTASIVALIAGLKPSAALRGPAERSGGIKRAARAAGVAFSVRRAARDAGIAARARAANVTGAGVARKTMAGETLVVGAARRAIGAPGAARRRRSCSVRAARSFVDWQAPERKRTRGSEHRAPHADERAPAHVVRRHAETLGA